MTFKIWDGSSWRDPTFVRRWNGSAWIDVGQASKWNGSAWEQVWPLVTLAVSISNRTIEDNTTQPTSAVARYRLKTTGVAEQELSTGATSISGEWLVSGLATDAEVRATVVSGTLSASSSTGVWLDFSADRTWSCVDNNTSINAAEILVEIRNKNTLTVLDSANIILRATQS